MRSHARVSLLALLTGAIIVVSAPAAQAAFGVEKFFAGNCGEKFEECGKGAKEGSEAEALIEGYRKAGGHPFFGVTDFIINTFSGVGALKQRVPQESVSHLRVDVAPGVVTNPQAVGQCGIKDFTSVEVAKGSGFFFESACPASSEIGENTVETAIIIPKGEPFEGEPFDVTFKGKVYNLEQPTGLGSEFGVALDLGKKVAGKEIFSHTLIKGNVEWGAEPLGTGQADYHDYFEIKNIPPGLIESRLVFKGHVPGTSGFLRNPSVCSKPGPETTTIVTAESEKGAIAKRPYQSPVGTNECEAEGFNPEFALAPATSASDAPDGIAPEAKMTHPSEASETDVSDLKTATFTLPEGLTMNPAAGAGLAGCTPAQIGIGTTKSVECPSGSRIGTVNLEIPTLPPGSLQGPIFLGKPAGEQITGPPYTIYFDAESARYGLKVRLKGTVTPNLATGQLTTTFTENPQAPFNSVTLHFNGGAFAPLANPLVCGVSKMQTSFSPFSGNPTLTGETPFTTEGCTSSPPPFAPTQSTSNEPAQGGGSSTFTLNLERPEGNQYLAKLRNVLPAGLVGIIPSVTLCGEAEANAGTCTSASQIGTVAVAAGSGEPFVFKGKVYLTGAFKGAPYGLSIVVSPSVGPFTLKPVIARATIEVKPDTGQVIATDNEVPMIVPAAGIPTRLRSLTLSINRQGFERNPTNCGVLATATTLTGALGANGPLGSTANLSTPFQAQGCSTLAFKPSFAATTNAKTSKNNGASLETTINQPEGQANIKSVLVSLPKQLPSRLTTLQKACPEATFAANPSSCPSGSLVGSARANTPVLPGKMTGPAYLVSHGGAAFPDLDLVLEDNGVRVIVVGNTDIKKGITTTNFATAPDVPVSSITVNLPTGPHSALGANGNLCATTLLMPTTITGQNGKQVKQNTKINVKGCGVQVVGQKVIGGTAFLTVKTFGAGRISGSGSGVATVFRTLHGASNATTLKVPVNGSRRRPFSTRIRVGFVPSRPGAHSNAFVTVRFR
jgi:hypothetical protein